MRFLNHINHMRGIAIVPVVVVHCIAIYTWEPGSAIDVLTPLFRNINILFVFVSGFLFAHISAELNYGSFLKRRFNNVILPYLLISIPAIAIYLVHLKQHPYLPPALLDLHPVTLAAFFILTGTHLGPLWFIPMMAIFYGLSFVFLRLVDSRAIWLLLPAWFVLSEAVGRPADNVGPLQLALYFAPVYMLGMLCARLEPWVAPRVDRWLAPALAAGAVAAVASVLLPARGIAAPHLVLKTVVCLSVYMLLLSLPDRRIPALDLLARNAFAIFFVHGYLVGFGRLVLGHGGHAIPGTLPRLLLSIGIVLSASLAIALAARASLGARSRLLLGS